MWYILVTPFYSILSHSPRFLQYIFDAIFSWDVFIILPFFNSSFFTLPFPIHPPPLSPLSTPFYLPSSIHSLRQQEFNMTSHLLSILIRIFKASFPSESSFFSPFHPPLPPIPIIHTRYLPDLSLSIHPLSMHPLSRNMSPGVFWRSLLWHWRN